MPQDLSRLTPEGIQTFRELLKRARQGTWPDFNELATDTRLTEQVAPFPLAKMPKSRRRRDVGLYLHELLEPLAATSDVTTDEGLWSWIALRWIEDLTSPPAHPRGIKSDYRYIPETGFKTYYRHLLLTPYRVCASVEGEADKAMALLCTPVWAPGDLNEQIASRQEIVANRSLLEAATLLYYDPSTDSGRKGFGSGPGCVSRFGLMMQMFGLTWDLPSMDANAILDLLPSEFDRFRYPASSRE